MLLKTEVSVTTPSADAAVTGSDTSSLTAAAMAVAMVSTVSAVATLIGICSPATYRCSVPAAAGAVVTVISAVPAAAAAASASGRPQTSLAKLLAKNALNIRASSEP